MALLHQQGLINAAVLNAGLPGLRMLARHGAGLDGIDVPAAAALGLTVTRAAGANARVGLIQDATGSYAPTLLPIAALAVTGAVIVLPMGRRSTALVADRALPAS